MYAVIEAGGKQHRVVAGDRLKVELISTAKKGDQITFDRVLMLGGDTVVVGQPLIKNASVVANVLDMGTDGRGAKAVKIDVYKKKRRKGYHKKIGHRQRYTEVEIQAINA